MEPTCTFYLCTKLDYMEAIAFGERDPEVLATYECGAGQTEEDLLANLKDYEARSWATFKVRAPVSIVKPGWGCAAIVEPLVPTHTDVIMTIYRHPSNAEDVLNIAGIYSDLLVNRRQALLTNLPEVCRRLDERVDQLWDELDVLSREGKRDSDEHREIHRSLNLRVELRTECERALDRGVQYLLVLGEH